MIKEVAVLDDNGKIITINLHSADYELKENEVIATSLCYIGGTFENGYFCPPQPYPSWIRNEYSWEAPVEYPTDGRFYFWEESLLSWYPVE